MDRIISKISGIIFITILCVFSPQLCFSVQEGLATATLKNFIKPQFNDQTKKLEYILTGTDAKSSGAVFLISNVRLELVGPDGKTITAVMTTPLANYNQATQFVNGDKEIKYSSTAFDAEGIGFDASQVTQTVHIRKQVKMTIKSMQNIGNGVAGNFKPSMLSLTETSDNKTQTTDTSAK